MIVEPFVKWGHKHPEKLFLIDGSGAILSAFLLGLVLVELESIFGIPRSTLYFLALWPGLFALYDFYGYFLKSKNTGALLKGIAFMNLTYCLISIAVAIYHSGHLTYFGWSYILLETIIVVTLAAIEWKVANHLIRQHKSNIIKN